MGSLCKMSLYFAHIFSIFAISKVYDASLVAQPGGKCNVAVLSFMPLCVFFPRIVKLGLALMF